VSRSYRVFSILHTVPQAETLIKGLPIIQYSHGSFLHLNDHLSAIATTSLIYKNFSIAEYVLYGSP